MYGFIYKTTNIINGKIYIGQRVYSVHTYQNDYYLGSGTILKQAIKKYGRENFIREILVECETLDEMNTMEEYYIKLFNSNNREIGYNIFIGGKQNGKHSETTRKLLSLRRKQYLSTNPDLKRNPHTEETKMKISKVHLGKKMSEESKRKMSLSRIGKPSPKLNIDDEWHRKQSKLQKSLHRKNTVYVETYLNDIFLSRLSMRQTCETYNFNRCWFSKKLKSTGILMYNGYLTKIVEYDVENKTTEY